MDQSTEVSTLQLKIMNFKNPYSTTPIFSPFAITLKTSTGELRASGGTGLTLTGYLPDALLSASLTPMNLTVGAEQANLTISLTAKNALMPQTKIAVYFPLWNPSETN